MSVVTTTILSDGTKLDASHEVLAIDIRREVNRIPQASLLLIDGDAALQKFAISDTRVFEPGREIEIRLRYEGAGQDTTVFKGPVVRHGVEASAQGSVLRVDLKDAALKMALGRKSAVFRDQSDDGVMRKLIGDAGLKVGSLAATKPVHSENLQYACSDWDFLVARADANGLLVVAEDGSIAVQKIDISGAASHQFDYGITELYNFEFELDAGQQFDSAQSTGWDMKEQKATSPAKAKSFALAQGNLDGAKLAKALGLPPLALSHPVPMAPEELQAWADARLQRNRLALIRGRLSTLGLPKLKLLDVVEIAGVGARFNGKALVTGLAHRVDDQGWRTDVQFGLSARPFCHEPGLQDAPAAGLLPGVGGLQIGVVAAFEDDPDKQLRVKLNLVGLGDQAGPVWARLATPDGGKERGWFFRPEPGDEVVVGFFNQDPRQPVVLGALFGSKNTPPPDLAELTKDNLAKGIVTRGGTKILFNDADKPTLTLETPAKNTIVLDDDKELIQIADKHGNKIILDKNGITLDSAKDLSFTAKGNVTIEGQKVDVK